jgi:hypothetical protein
MGFAEFGIGLDDGGGDRTSATPSEEARSPRLSAPPVYQTKLDDRRNRSAPSFRRSIYSLSLCRLDLWSVGP